MNDPLADLGITAEQFPSERFGDTAGNVNAIIEEASYIYGVDSDLIRAVVGQESGGNPSATSYLGAAGMMQLMPETALALGVDDPYDPEENIMAGTRLLRQNLDRFGEREDLALAAFHGGPKVVRPDGTINPESNDGLSYTTDYVRRILSKRDRLRGISAAAPSLDELDVQELDFPDQPAGTQPPMDNVQVPYRRDYEPEEEGVSPELVGALAEERPSPVSQEDAEALKRGLGVAPPPEYKTAEPQAYEDYSKMRSMMKRPPEEVVTQATPEEVQKGLQAGPAKPTSKPQGDVVPAADVVRATPDPYAKAAFMANLSDQEKNALLAEMPEAIRADVEQAVARISQEQGGPAFGFGAIKSSPIWALVPKEAKRYAESAMRSNPTASMLGQVTGTVVETIGLGGVIGSSAKFQKAMQGAKAIENKLARIAAVKGLQALQRGATGGAISGMQQLQMLNEGQITLAEAIRNTGTAAIASALSVGPEGVSKVLPTGTKMAGEVLVQVGAGALTNYLLDKKTGREYSDEETIELLNVQVPKEYLLNAAMDLVFAGMDARSQGAEFGYAPKAEADAGRQDFDAQEIAGAIEATGARIAQESNISREAADKIALDTYNEQVEAAAKAQEAEQAAQQKPQQQTDLIGRVPETEKERKAIIKAVGKRFRISPKNAVDVGTQIPGRNFIRKSVTKELNKGAKGKPILFFDLDDTKALNEVFGHDQTDFVFEGIGAAIRRHFGDRVYGRQGGEEFAVILEPGDIDRVRMFLEDVGQNIRVAGEPVTISGGVGIGRTPDRKMRADVLSGEAKRAGKNRIHVDIEGEKPYIIKGPDSGRKLYIEAFARLNAAERLEQIAKEPGVDNERRQRYLAEAEALRGEYEALRNDIEGGGEIRTPEVRDAPGRALQVESAGELGDLQRSADTEDRLTPEPGPLPRQEPFPTESDTELAARVQDEQAEQTQQRRVTTPRPEIEETSGTRSTSDQPEQFPQPTKVGKLEKNDGSIRLGGPEPESAQPEAGKPEPEVGEKKPRTIGGVPKNAIARFMQKEFASRGLLPEKAFESKLLKDFKIAKAIKQIELTVGDFERSVNEAWGRKPTDEQIFQVDMALKGQTPITELPESLRPVVKDMRTQIDALTQRFIDEGLVEGELAGVLADNMGFYATRSYRVNDIPDWAKIVWKEHPNVIRNAQALIRGDLRDFHVSKALDAQTRIDELQAQRAELTMQQRAPESVPDVDEKMLRFNSRADEVLTKAGREVQRRAKRTVTDIERRKAKLDRRIEQLNEQKTQAYRTRKVTGDRRPGIERAIDSKQRRMTKLDEQIEELGLEGQELDEAVSLLDDIQGQLAKLESDLLIEPTTLKDIDDVLARFNDRRHALEATKEKLQTRGADDIVRAMESVGRRTDRLLFQLNKQKTDVFRAPSQDTDIATRSIEDQVSAIDARLDRLDAVRRGHETRSVPSDDEVNRLINELLYRDNGPAAILAGKGKLGAKNLAMLKRRKEIPWQIRALWGEYKNADVNYARSVAQMAQTLANHEFLKEVAEQGRGEFLWREGDREMPSEAYVKIAAEGNPALKPLDGMYTTPEIAQAFKDATSDRDLPDWYRLWLKGVGSAKYAKTVASWMTHARNVTGNVGFAVANGHFNVSKMGEAWNGTFKDFLNDQPIEIMGVTLNKPDEKVRQRMLRLTELGVISQGVRANEVKGIIQDATNGKIDVLIGTGPKKRLKKMGSMVTKAYGAEDDVWKWFAFENELARYRKALPDMSTDELERHVARIVIDTYPTYAMTPEMIQRLRRFPIVGTFVSFPAEVIRTGKNRAMLTLRELRDPRLRAIGAQRLVGQMLAYTIPAGLGVATRLATGTTRKKEDAMRKLLPPWSENSRIIHTGMGSDNKPTYVDLSYTDPNSVLGNVAIALLRGGDEREITQRIVAAAGELLEPFISEDLVAQKLFDIKRNKKKDGGPVYNEADTPLNMMLDWVEHIGDAFIPGSIVGMQRMYKATQGAEGKSGTPYDFKTELIAQGTGVRVTTADFPRALGFKARRFRDKLQKARELEFTRGQTLSEQQEGVIYDDFYETIKAAYITGMSKSDVIGVLSEWGLSRSQAHAIAHGKYDRYLKQTRAKRALRRAKQGR